MDGSTDQREFSLVIAIPTYNRTERLAELLPLVGRQLAELATVGLPIKQTAILVVDNDPEGSARPVVAPRYEHSPAYHVVEKTPGIPAVRNRALKESTEFDVLSFIDDDELPRDGWIRSLAETWIRSGRPTAVMGRVVSILADDVDPWVLASGDFQRPQHPTGTEIKVAATGNLLLDLQKVRASGVQFDERIGLGGGSDTLFSMALVKHGGRIVWCNESVAEDTVELARQTRSWLIKRWFSHGNVTVYVRLRLEHRPWRLMAIRLKWTVGGVVRIVVGVLQNAIGWLLHSYHHRAKGRRLATRGAGMIAACIGRRYHAYSRPTGTADGTA